MTPVTAAGSPPRRFFVAAAGMGVAFANSAVAVPLLVLSLGGDAALAGGLLAAGTVSVAVGALLGGVASRRAGGGARALALALGLSLAGSTALALATSVATIGAAAAILGLGVGVFWVASQLMLGRRSGRPGSEKGFLVHYASYTFGAVVGSSMTGAAAALGAELGLRHATAIRTSALAAAGTLLLALALWRPLATRAGSESPARRIPVAPVRHLRIQSSDLLLVGALGCLLPLTPVVLERGYHLGPFAIGLIVASVSLAKIAGTLVARALSRSSGQRSAILLLLGAASSFCALLAVASTAPVFVAALLVTALAGTGAWPIVVDSAQARVQPDRRHGLTVLWNAREYAVIAAATACSGWLFGVFGTPAPLFLLAAGLIAAAAVCSKAVLSRPVWQPDEAPPREAAAVPSV
jgi:MFS family permease